jgi:hypothetical protein
MKRFLRGVLPHISIALTIVLMVVVYLDRRNPMMGFLVGAPFFTLVVLSGAASIATSIVLYSRWRKPKKRKKARNDT